jgi:hypothetical protein
MNKSTIRIVVPDLDKFVVRATLPLPKGFKFSTESCPFTLVAPDGTELVTQWEQVSRLADNDISVCQVLAICERGGLAIGSSQDFALIEKEQATDRFVINDDITQLISTSNSVRIRTEDVFGNKYEQALNIDGSNSFTGSIDFLAGGPVQQSARISRRLELSEEVDSPLEHAGGFHAVATVNNDDTDVVGLVLNWHNGFTDDVISDLYFKSLELVLPAGWNVISEWPEPFMGEAYEEGQELVVPIIKPTSDGTMHLLMQMDNREWRLYIYKTGSEDAASQVALQGGWGVCVHGEGEWNWHSKDVRGYQAQHFVLPKLDHINDLKGRVKGNYDTIINELENGLPYNAGGGGDGQLGYRNPAGVAYGGMSGGTDINEVDGHEAAAAGTLESLLFHRVLARRYGDRQRGYLFTSNGKPIRIDDYLNPDGSMQSNMFDFVFINKGYPNANEKDDAPFEFDEADDFQVQKVIDDGLVPIYEDRTRAYAPIDSQHIIRRVKDLRTLVYLDNDHSAKLHLQMHAECTRMTYFEKKGGRLKSDADYSVQFPNKGCSWGRAEAHAMDIGSVCFAILDDAWRNRHQPWLDTLRDVSLNVQGANGIWDRHFNGKVIDNYDFNGQYSAMRPHEQQLTMAQFRSLQKSVYQYVDQKSYDDIGKSIFLGGVGLWTLLWKRDINGVIDGEGPWDTVAVGSLLPASEMYKTFQEWAPEQYSSPEDSIHTPSVLGILLEDTVETSLEPAVRFVISKNTGDPDLLTSLKTRGLQYMNHNAHLLAVVQILDS